MTDVQSCLAALLAHALLGAQSVPDKAARALDALLATVEGAPDTQIAALRDLQSSFASHNVDTDMGRSITSEIACRIAALETRSA